MTLEHLQLVFHDLRVPEQIARIAVLGDQSKGLPLAASSDQDRRPASLHGPGRVQRPVDPIMPAFERGRLLLEHRPADLQGLLQPLQSFPGRREMEPVSTVLVVVPGRADPEDRAP
jgi:hypothetical protein